MLHLIFSTQALTDARQMATPDDVLVLLYPAPEGGAEAALPSAPRVYAAAPFARSWCAPLEATELAARVAAAEKLRSWY